MASAASQPGDPLEAAASAMSRCAGTCFAGAASILEQAWRLMPILEEGFSTIRSELGRVDSKSATLVGLAGTAAVCASGLGHGGGPLPPRILATAA